ncbi:chorismate mutase [Pseudomonas indica]|uniref:chorismate mutase n=1 Tax=Pseudomonas indica TaxID=137658 RepID=UPI003FD4031C
MRIRRPPLAALLFSLALGSAQAGETTTPALDALIRVSTERLLLADQVAASKAQSGKAVEDAARESEQLATLSAKAPDYRLTPEQVTAFFKWQIEANKLVQYRLLAKPAPASGTPVSLDAIRARLNTINVEILENLAPALAELQQHGCAETLYEGIRRRTKREHLDALHKTALVRAFGDTCRSL